MVDAIAAVMAMEDKEFYKVGELAVAVMIETATTITGDPYKVMVHSDTVTLWSLLAFFLNRHKFTCVL